jgi:putative SOS response-associated peptidase YedK
MCGRAVIIDREGIERIAIEFSVPFSPSMWKPRYNVRPTQTLPALRRAGSGYTVDELRWGLIPFWSKEPVTKYPTFNARSEAILEKPTYREPFKRRRCLLLVDGFYEWPKKPSKDRNPRLVRFTDRRCFAIAGLWDAWTDPATGEAIESCTVVTTAANDLLASVPHDRMPVILEGDARRAWLDPETPLDELAPLLAPLPADEMELVIVGSQFVNYSVDDERCVEAARGFQN